MPVARHFKQHFKQRWLNAAAYHPTLAPNLTPENAAISTTFHRALAEFNQYNNSDLTWHDLSVEEQAAVKAIYARLVKEDHPCSR